MSDWDLDEEISDVFTDIERSMEDAFSGFHRSLFDMERRCLKPLYKIESSEDQIIVTFDLPCVERKEDLTISATEDSFTLEAIMRKPVSLMLGGTYQRNVEFDKYSKNVRLPRKVNPEQAKARFSNGLLIVQFPTKKLIGTSVKID